MHTREGLLEERGENLSKRYFELLFPAIAVALLFFLKFYSYLLFHSMAEIFSVAIAVSIFMLTWSARRNIDNGSLIFLGIAYLSVGFIDLLHMLVYSGMGLSKNDSSNLPTQLWICARFIESISLFIAPFLSKKRVGAGAVITVYSAVTGLLLLSIFRGIFPDCFIDGSLGRRSGW